MLSSIPANAEIEIVLGKKLEQLPENGFAGIHGDPPKVLGGYHRSKFKSKTKKLCQRAKQFNNLALFIKILPDSSDNMYVNAQFRQEFYQDIYITALSVKNMIEIKQLIDEPEGSGEMNGFSYSYHSKQLKTVKNYVYPDPPIPGGNIGPFELTLYEVDCKLSKDQWKKEFSFYVTQFKGNPALLKEF